MKAADYGMPAHKVAEAERLFAEQSGEGRQLAAHPSTSSGLKGKPPRKGPAPPPRPAAPRRSKQMNKLESAYVEQLAIGQAAGRVLHFGFECITLRLADGVRYTPDFFVVRPGGKFEFHETKGFMRDDARIKLKVAAQIYPWFTFHLVQHKKRAWIITQIQRTP